MALLPGPVGEEIGPRIEPSPFLDYPFPPRRNRLHYEMQEFFEDMFLRIHGGDRMWVPIFSVLGCGKDMGQFGYAGFCTLFDHFHRGLVERLFQGKSRDHLREELWGDSSDEEPDIPSWAEYN
jgi:hypothetical protein